MKKRALLVGINYTGTRNELRGCINDVILMNNTITHKFGFTDNKNKRTLTDSSATTQNILERLEWLVDDAQPGDVLFFHYSGHGSQIISTDYNNDYEPDGKDEIICPIDLNWRDKVIKDDDFKRIFSRLPEDVNLTILLDCCHSGDGIDNGYEYKPTMLTEKSQDIVESPNRNRLLPMPVDIESRGFGLKLQTRKVGAIQRDSSNSGLLISGCQSQQTSADAWIHNKFQGAATFFLNYVLAKHNYNCTYLTLIDHMNIKLNKYKYQQRPELDGNKKLFKKNFLQPFI